MQFAIHAPQTVNVANPDDKDAAPIQLNFRMNGADTSRCVLEVILPEKGVAEFTFNTRGNLVTQKFTPQGEERDAAAKPVAPVDYMVDGRDTRADNPYTHVAPVDADTASRDAQAPQGFRSPFPVENEGDLRKQAMEKAASAAEKARSEQQAERDKSPEDKARERQEAQDKRREDGLKASEQDAANRIPAQGGVIAGASQQVAAPYDPNIPPASSPLPGSPAPQPESQRDHGIVNRSDGTSVNTEKPPVPPSEPYRDPGTMRSLT